jgi:lipopolysaccharide transport system permease protein
MSASHTASPNTNAPRSPATTGSLRRTLGLTATLAEREFLATYRGNLTGAITSILVPLVMLGTYTFVFSVLIPVRVRPGQSDRDYAFFLFAGLIAWNLFAEVAARAPRLYTSSSNYVNRPQFPISAIVAAPCLAAFYRSLPWLAAFVIAHWGLIERPPTTWLLAPLVLLWTALLTLAISLVLASLGALVRDIGDIVPPGLTLLFFLSPVLYPAEMLAQVTVWLERLNPLSPPLVILRGLLLDGTLPSPTLFGLATISTLVWTGLGVLSYRATRPLLQDLV